MKNLALTLVALTFVMLATSTILEKSREVELSVAQVFTTPTASEIMRPQAARNQQHLSEMKRNRG